MDFKLKPFLFSCVLSLLALCCPASLQAQDIGNVGFRTIVQKVFQGQSTAVATPANSSYPCLPTNGNPCTIPNFGQNVHAVAYQILTPCNTGFFMDLRIEATQDGITWFPISPDATDQNSGNIQGATSLGLSATGLYAGLRLNLVSISCDSGQSTGITATYTGTFSSNPPQADVFYQSSPVRKLLVQNLPTTGGFTTATVPALNGSTAGMVFVQCSTVASGASQGCPATTVQVNSYVAFGSSVGGGGGGNPNTSSLTYTVPSTNGAIIQLQSFPASSITFLFSTAGSAGVNLSAYYFPNLSPPSSSVADPCASPGAVKQSAFANITTATTTTIVPILNQTLIFVCQIVAQLNSTTASTILFEYGTGASCSTGTVVKTATYTNSTLVSAPVILGGGSASVFATPFSANGVCAVTTVGTSPTIPVTITYVQQ